jgi:LAS superfamily LD-carboxypeptidase LdcB
MGLQDDYSAGYNNLVGSNKQFNTQLPTGLDTSVVAEEVAKKGQNSSGLVDAIGKSIDSPNLNPQQVQFLSDPANAGLVLQQIAIAKTAIAESFLQNILADEARLQNGKQTTELIQHQEQLMAAMKQSSRDSAIAKIFNDTANLQNAIDKTKEIEATKNLIKNNESEKSNNSVANKGQETGSTVSNQTSEEKQTKAEENTNQPTPTKEKNEENTDTQSSQNNVAIDSAGGSNTEKSGQTLPTVVGGTGDNQPIPTNNTTPTYNTSEQGDNQEITEEQQDNTPVPVTEQQDDQTQTQKNEVSTTDKKNEGSTEGEEKQEDNAEKKEPSEKGDNAEKSVSDENSKESTESKLPSQNKYDTEPAPKDENGEKSVLDNLRDNNGLPANSASNLKSPQTIQPTPEPILGGASSISPAIKPGALADAKLKSGDIKQPESQSGANDSANQGSAFDRAKSMMKNLASPQNAAKDAGQKLASQLGKQAASWAVGALGPIIPWLLLFILVLSLFIGLLSGMLIRVYCFPQEDNLFQLRNGLEYALTGDPSFLANEGLAQVGRVLGVDNYIREKVVAKSDLGMFIEKYACTVFNPNSCGDTGATPANLGGGFDCKANKLTFTNENGTPVNFLDLAYIPDNPNLYYFLASMRTKEFNGIFEGNPLYLNGDADSCGAYQQRLGEITQPVTGGNVAPRLDTVLASKAKEFYGGALPTGDEVAVCKTILDKVGMGFWDKLAIERIKKEGNGRYYDKILKANLPGDCDDLAQAAIESQRPAQRVRPEYKKTVASNCKYMVENNQYETRKAGCTGQTDIKSNSDITLQKEKNKGLTLDNIASYVQTPQGINFLLNGGLIKTEAAGSPGGFTYNGEDQAVLKLIADGKIYDNIYGVAERGTFKSQVEKKFMHPVMLQAMVKVITANPDLDYIEISSAYRAGDNVASGHGSGQKIDIPRIKFKGQIYDHEKGNNGVAPDAVAKFMEVAEMFQSTGVLRHIITGDNHFEALSANPKMKGVTLKLDSKSKPQYGGIHHNHYDLAINPSGSVGDVTYELDPNCACGNSGEGADTSALTGESSKDLDEVRTKNKLQSISVTELEGDKAFSSKGNEPPASPASTIKVAVANALIDEINKGTVKLDQKIIIDNEVADDYEPNIGRQLSVQEALIKMLNESKNSETNALVKLLGGKGSAINQKFSGLGFKNTQFNRYLSKDNQPGSTQTNSATADDITTAMKKLFKGTSASHTIAQNALKNPKQAIGSFSYNGAIANKVGNNSKVLGNSAVVSAGGKKYVITMYANVDGSVAGNKKYINDGTNAVIKLLEEGSIGLVENESTLAYEDDNHIHENEPQSDLYIPKVIRLIGSNLVVEAAYGTKPTTYADITDKHQKFLFEVAKERKYIKYKDAGKEDPDMRKAFNAMQAEAKKSGQNLEIKSGHRSYDQQVGTFFSASGVTNPISNYFGDNITDAERSNLKIQYLKRGEVSAPPGFSEHSTGLAIDINELNVGFKNTSEYKWLSENATKFGFKLSYPEGSTEGAGFEPWHWVFVGNDTYKASNKLATYATEGDPTAPKANEACICNKTTETKPVDEEGNVKPDEAKPANGTATDEKKPAFSKPNPFSILASIVLGGVQTEARVNAVAVGTYNPLDKGGEDGIASKELEPDKYDFKRKTRKTRTSGSDNTTDYFVTTYYRFVNDERPGGNIDDTRQKFHDEIAKIYNLKTFNLAPGYQQNIQPKLDKLNEISRKHGLTLKGQPMIWNINNDQFKKGYRNHADQAALFYTENENYKAGFLENSEIFDKLYNLVLTEAQYRTVLRNTFPSYSSQQIDAIMQQNPTFEKLLKDGNSIEQIQAKTGYLLQKTDTLPTTGRRNSQNAAIRDNTNFNYVISLDKLVTVEEVFNKRFKVVNSYAERAYYYPPVNYDDRQTGKFVTIFEPFEDLIADNANAPEKFELDIDPDYSATRAENAAKSKIEAKKGKRVISVQRIYKGDEGKLFGLVGKVDAVFLATFEKDYSLDFDKNKLITATNSDIENPTSDIDIVPDNLIDQQGKIHAIDWFTQFAPQVGLIPTSTEFADNLSGDIQGRVQQLTSEYQSDKEGNPVYDENEQPIKNSGYLSPINDGNNYTSIENAEDFKSTPVYKEETANNQEGVIADWIAGKWTSPSPNFVPWVADNESSQKFFIFANYIKDLNKKNPSEIYTLEADPAKNREGIDLFRVLDAMRSRKQINTQKSQSRNAEFNQADQDSSPRQQKINALNGREKALFDELDGDLVIVVKEIRGPSRRSSSGDSTSTTSVSYAYDISDPGPKGVDINDLESPFYNVNPSEEDYREVSQDREPKSDFTPSNRNVQDTDAEKSAFEFYKKSLYVENSTKQYAETLDKNLNITEDEVKRLEVSSEMRYWQYDEKTELEEEQKNTTSSSTSGNTGTSNTNQTKNTASAATITTYETDCNQLTTGEFSGQFTNPLPKGKLKSGFGDKNGITLDALLYATDATAPAGDVLAAAPGKVVEVSTDAKANTCGFFIVIEHDEGIQTGYCHMEEPSALELGDTVIGGQVLGKEGKSGDVQSRVLRFWLNKDGKKVDPCQNGLKCN